MPGTSLFLHTGNMWGNNVRTLLDVQKFWLETSSTSMILHKSKTTEPNLTDLFKGEYMIMTNIK